MPLRELRPFLFASRAWVWGCCVCRFLWWFFWRSFGGGGQRTIPYGILLAKFGSKSYIENIGLGVPIFMAQQVAKHMAKAGLKMSISRYYGCKNWSQLLRFGEAWNTRLESKKRPMQTLPDWTKIPTFLPKMWPNPCKISKKNYQKKYEKMAFWPLNS